MLPIPQGTSAQRVGPGFHHVYIPHLAGRQTAALRSHRHAASTRAGASSEATPARAEAGSLFPHRRRTGAARRYFPIRPDSLVFSNTLFACAMALL